MRSEQNFEIETLKTGAREGGTTALYFAVKRGDAEIVEILMRHGANPQSRMISVEMSCRKCDAFSNTQIKGAILSREYSEKHETCQA